MAEQTRTTGEQGARVFDRAGEDVGNIVMLEHVNLTVPDQGVAALFYVTGLGFTRDPYIDFGTFNMWVNLGEQQFHLPKAKAQVFRGHIAVVVPDLEDLKKRLKFISKPMVKHLSASSPICERFITAGRSNKASQGVEMGWSNMRPFHPRIRLPMRVRKAAVLLAVILSS